MIYKINILKKKEYITKYCYHEILSKNEFLLRYCNSHISTFVYLDEACEKPIDLLSYYVVDCEKTRKIRATFLYLYTSNVVTPLCLLNNLAALSTSEDTDVLFITDALENNNIVFGNKYTKIEASHKLYFYNYKCPQLLCSQIYKHIFM